MWVLHLLSFAILVDSKSSGIVTTGDISLGCDWEKTGVITQWGCQTRRWNSSNDFPFARGFCQDANYNTAKFMWWVGAPQDADVVWPGAWSIRTGNGDPSKDPKTYVPNQYVSIYIKVLKFDGFYKGLLMFAKDSNGNKTGDWNIPLEASPQFATTPSIQCAKSVMHFNAEDKPYVQKFNFLAPPAGTGPITIKAMLKTGPPNPTNFGDFVKLPPLELQEQTAAQSARKWVLLNGTTCTDYCNNINPNIPCNDVSLQTSMDGIQPNPLDTIYPCHGAIFHDCNGNPRVQLPDRFCTYPSPVCSPIPTTPAKCSTIPSADTPTFCICGAPITGSPTAAPTVPGTLPVTASASRLVSGFGVLLALVSMGAWGTKSQVAWAAMGFLLTAIPSASAHNWMEGTRGRASNLGANTYCSPAFPQINRQKIHMQVALDQPFVVEWASAHGDYTYWIVIHDDDRANVSKLTRSLMDSWLAACPGGGYANTTTTGMKYHRFRPNKLLTSTSAVNGASANAISYATAFYPDPIYNGSVYNSFSLSASQPGRPSTFYFPTTGMTNCGSQRTGPEVIPNYNCSSMPQTMLARYRELYLTGDRRCTYVNSTNPWIHTIHRYQHNDVSDGLATALLTIPSNPNGGVSKTGRYQVHYKWSSYCDTIDVDVKAANMPVSNPYGVPINATDLQYDIAHHCKFDLGQGSKVGQCVEVVTTTQQCEALCDTDSNCRGFQLLPLQLDNSNGQKFGLFPESSYIPWGSQSKTNLSFCDKSQFANVPTTATSMVCYTITSFQDSFNSARPLWSFTDDTDHQGFYGTCYIKPILRSFGPSTPVAEDRPSGSRFQSKCVPCDNIGQDLRNPRWGPQLNYCTDCTKYPSAPRQLPTLPTWTAVSTGTFNQSAHWLSPGGSPYAFKDECITLALRDKTCSNYVMYSDYRAQRYGGNISGTRPSDFQMGTNGGVRLINTSFSWHYSPSTLNNPYFRSCACLDKAVADALGGSAPVIDVTMTNMACDGVTKMSDCVYRNFTIYKLP